MAVGLYVLTTFFVAYVVYVVISDEIKKTPKGR